MDLYTCSHVFVRTDAVKRPLQAAYERPYQVLKRISDRVFVLDVKGQETAISKERIKPAYFESEFDHNTTSDVIQETSVPASNKIPTQGSSPNDVSRQPFKTYAGPKKQVHFVIKV